MNFLLILTTIICTFVKSELQVKIVDEQTGGFGRSLEDHGVLQVIKYKRDTIQNANISKKTENTTINPLEDSTTEIPTTESNNEVTSPDIKHSIETETKNTLTGSKETKQDETTLSGGTESKKTISEDKEKPTTEKKLPENNEREKETTDLSTEITSKIPEVTINNDDTPKKETSPIQTAIDTLHSIGSTINKQLLQPLRPNIKLPTIIPMPTFAPSRINPSMPTLPPFLPNIKLPTLPPMPTFRPIFPIFGGDANSRNRRDVQSKSIYLQSNAINSLDEMLPCSKEGYFRLNQSCTRFYECFFSEEYQKIISSPISTCPGCLKFNALTMRCDLPRNVPECALPPQSENQNYCTGPGKFPVPNDCHKYYDCKKDTNEEKFSLTIRTCPSQTTFNHSKNECVKDDKCVTFVSKSNCYKPDFYMSDKYDCGKFYYCSIKFGLIPLYCPKNTIFNGYNCETESSSNLLN